MNQVYTLRVVVSLSTEDGGVWQTDSLGVRTQEVTGDLAELGMMALPFGNIAGTMTHSVVSAEILRQHKQRETEKAGDIPY